MRAIRWAMLLLWGSLGLVLQAQAQSGATIAIGEPHPQRPPVIWIDPALGKLEPIELASLSIDIRLQGFLATTTLDLSFHNPNNRVLEGELVLPLATGQSITGYALEVDGKLRQGVAVPKETARVAFEEITRRGVDPGLAELTQGNVFRTRLYPIPAQGNKRVVLSFDQPLLDVGKAWRYVLPMQFEQPIGHFKVHAEALRSEQTPTVEGNIEAFGFKRWRDSFVADLDEKNFQPTRELAFSVPKPASSSSVFRVVDRLEPAWSTFAAQLDTGLPSKLSAAVPKRIALFYDASGSAAKRDRERENRLISAWLAQLGSVDVQLLAFRDAAEDIGNFPIRGGDSSALLAAIRALPLDGGSSYGTIDRQLAPQADTLVIVGDGLSNFGGHEPRIEAGKADSPRIVLLHAAQASDPARLNRLVRLYGGTLINLLDSTPEEALLQLQTPRWRLLSSTVKSGECVDLAPAAPSPATASFSLYGRCKGEASLELVFGSGDGKAVQRTVSLAATSPLEPEHGRFINRLWATARITDLEQSEGPESAAALQLATQFGVVSARTSLLVLDRIEDYVRYRIEPAEAELAAQYRQMLGSEVKTSVVQVDRAHLDEVLAQWHEFRDWHARRHPWLETVLAPTVQAELARWQSLQSDPRMAALAKAHLPELEALNRQAQDMAGSWLKAGANESTRVIWEKQAAELMLKLDDRRQQRLKAWPESESVAVGADSGPSEVAATMVGEAMMESMDVASSPIAESAAPPAPAPEPMLARRALADVSSSESAAAGAPGGAADDRKQVADAEAPAGFAAPKPSAPVSSATIELSAWNPDTPYLAKLRAAKEPYTAYLRERESQASTPAFFLDCADFFRTEAKQPALALRVLSNLAEIDVESAPLLRVLGYRLGHWDRFDLAVPLFETALKLRGEEPQSRRDLALALSRQNTPDYARAVALLWEVVSRRWDGRFPGIEVIALHELNDVLARMPVAASAELDLVALGIPPVFVEAIPVDLRVVLSWDADNTDIDLWVIDPSGETAIYSNPQTATGGQVSRDFTGGYGPEVFTIKRALPGTYVVKAHYYGDRQQKLTGAVTVQLEFLTHFNTGDSARAAVTRRLEGDEDQIEIGRFRVETK